MLTEHGSTYTFDSKSKLISLLCNMCNGSPQNSGLQVCRYLGLSYHELMSSGDVLFKCCVIYITSAFRESWYSQVDSSTMCGLEVRVLQNVVCTLVLYITEEVVRETTNSRLVEYLVYCTARWLTCFILSYKYILIGA